MKCYKCGIDGEHYAATCPELVPASSFDEHLARIDRIVNRWCDGEITREVKRRAISAENQLWYGEHCRRELTYP
jgi:hypothetical protein